MKCANYFLIMKENDFFFKLKEGEGVERVKIKTKGETHF